MLTEREEMIVDWIERLAPTLVKSQRVALELVASNIRSGAHLKRPEPTIPASE